MNSYRFYSKIVKTRIFKFFRLVKAKNEGEYDFTILASNSPWIVTAGKKQYVALYVPEAFLTIYEFAKFTWNFKTEVNCQNRTFQVLFPYNESFSKY